MYYRIGLDIGITSVGWCAMMTDEYGEPLSIVALGARIFDAAETPETGASLAEPRRIARGLRRRLRRRKLRIQEAKKFLTEQGCNIVSDKDVNLLRVYALDNPVSRDDFAAVLLALIKRRGFKSNRKSAESKEEGLLLTATKDNHEKMLQKGYRTVGEMFVKENTRRIVAANGEIRNVYYTRNRGGTYEHTVLRDDLRREIETLFSVQASFGNSLATDSVKNTVLDLFDRQRGYDEGPGKGSPYSGGYTIGKCEFEQTEERAPKSSYTFERFSALQKLNNLKIVSSGSSRELNEEERGQIIKLIDERPDIKYDAIRKLLKLSDDETFNALTYSVKAKKKPDTDNAAVGIAEIIKECEKAVFVSMKRSTEIGKCLDEANRTGEVIDEIAYVLSHVKGDERRLRMFSESGVLSGLSDAEKNALLALNCDKFGNLSLKAMRNVMPYLEQGKKYSDACAAYGYNHSLKEYSRSSLLNSREVHETVDTITSPVVKRAVSQTLKVLNAIIRKYGSPLAVNIELARDMSRSFEERKKMKKENDRRADDNRRIREQLRERFGIEPRYADVLKWRLYEDQQGKCPYTGRIIDVSRLYENNYVQIDHIIPYSQCFDDGYNNKVLVMTAANQNKGNRTPFEWLGATETWNDFYDRVCVMYASDLRKKRMLLTERYNPDEWKSRALNDTRYISRFVYNLINDRLLFEQGACGKKRVTAVNGAVTAYLRRQWGIGKVREDGDLHHAVDAAVIACTTDGAIKRISDAQKRKENRLTKDDAPRDGGHIEVEPYDGFSNELKARCMSDQEQMREALACLGIYNGNVSSVQPVFVSRMPKRKGKGAIHAETVRSAKYIDMKDACLDIEGPCLVSKTPLKKLRLSKDKERIEGYFRPQDDRKTYELLLRKLIDADGNAKVAFAEKVYKPAADGKQGNEIKKVKICKPASVGVYFDKIKGYADNANGSMIRIDVFCEKGKYYCVPVYTADLYVGIMPNKAATANKKKEEWPEMQEDNFLFSLYPNDLIYIEHKNGITMQKSRDNTDSRLPQTLTFKEGFVYYNNFDSAVAAAKVINHTNCYETRIGLKTLKSIRKCYVDVLGNISFVDREKRPPLAFKGKK